MDMDWKDIPVVVREVRPIAVLETEDGLLIIQKGDRGDDQGVLIPYELAAVVAHAILDRCQEPES